MLYSLFSGGFSLEALLSLLITLPFLMLSLSVHEYAHAFAAHKQGDDYARVMGRMTINPLKHIDPLGLLMLVLVGFGWAKPVPIVPSNFKNGRKSMIIVSIAGVLANLIMAFIAINLLYFLNYTCGLYFFVTNPAIWAIVLSDIFIYFITVNITLCVFNLIPLPPLDGYKVVRELFYSFRSRNIFDFLDRYGNFILIVLIIFGGTSGIISQVSGFILRLMEQFCMLIY